MRKITIICVISLLILISGIVVGYFYLRPQTPLFSQSTREADGVQTPNISSRPLFIYGYLPYWTRTTAQFSDKLSVVSYFSLGIQADGHFLNLPKALQETGYRAYQAGVLQNLRNEIHPTTKLEITLTMMNQDTIPGFIASESAQQNFLSDLQILVNSAPIGGVNIDIEYNGSADNEMQQNFANLLHTANTILKTHSPSETLSVATYSDAGTTQRLTNLHLIAPEVDHIIMMAYDYHRYSSIHAGPNAPLYGKSENKWSSDVMSDLKAYTDVVPAEKILLGVPLYGYEWVVQDSSDPQSFTVPKSGQTALYSRTQTLRSQKNVRVFWDASALSPYLQFDVNGKHHLIYYDNIHSLQYRLQLVQSAGLGGIAIWALGYEGQDSSLWSAIQ